MEQRERKNKYKYYGQKEEDKKENNPARLSLQ